MFDMNIEKVSNGYLITSGVTRRREVHKTIEEVFREALLYFEGKSEHFGGDSYAKISIQCKKEEK